MQYFNPHSQHPNWNGNRRRDLLTDCILSPTSESPVRRMAFGDVLSKKWSHGQIHQLAVLLTSAYFSAKSQKLSESQFEKLDSRLNGQVRPIQTMLNVFKSLYLSAGRADEGEFGLLILNNNGSIDAIEVYHASKNVFTIMGKASVGSHDEQAKHFSSLSKTFFDELVRELFNHETFVLQYLSNAPGHSKAGLDFDSFVQSVASLQD